MRTPTADLATNHVLPCLPSESEYLVDQELHLPWIGSIEGTSREHRQNPHLGLVELQKAPLATGGKRRSAEKVCLWRRGDSHLQVQFERRGSDAAPSLDTGILM